MRYLPLNQNDRAQMLDVIGVDNIDGLFTDVPKSARLKGLIDLPKHQSEQAVEQFFQRLSNKSTPAGSVCLLYTSPSPRDLSTSRMPSSA